MKSIKKFSPFLESYKKNDIEVLILDDKEIDEIITPAIGAYKSGNSKILQLVSLQKLNKQKKRKKEVEEKFQDIH